MNHEDQPMMNQARAFIPEDEPNDEDLPPAMKRMYDFLGELSEKIQSFNSTMRKNTSPSQPLAVPEAIHEADVMDTGKTIEQELRLFPNPTREELKLRLDDQVWDLLRLMHRRVVQGTYDETDVKLIEGLQVISVLHARLGVHTEIALKHSAKRP